MTETTPLRFEYHVALPAFARHAQIGARGPQGDVAQEDLRRLWPNIHALDRAILDVLQTGVVFGQTGLNGLARLIPLLMQRRTWVNQTPLAVADEPVRPKLSVTPRTGRIEIRVVVGDAEAGDVLLAGPEGFLFREGRLYPVECPLPWELAHWFEGHTILLSTDATPRERDRVVGELRRLGIPDGELAAMEVRRTPPDGFAVELHMRAERLAGLSLWAMYGSARVSVTGRKQAAHVATAESLLERDLVAEANAIAELRTRGFRYQAKDDCFLATDDSALAAFDPHQSAFPKDWAVTRGDTLTFHRDLSVSTEVAAHEEQADFLVDVNLMTVDDDVTVSHLVDMQELIEWLRTESRYLKLRDGSYVAPSRAFIHTLKILDDLGTTSARIHVSPMCAGLLLEMSRHSEVHWADEVTRRWFEEIVGHHAPAVVEPPEEVRSILRDYQRSGLDWLAMLTRYRLAGVLADDMGLGKTLQALSLLRQSQAAGPSLVVAPTSAVHVWVDEAEKFLPTLRVLLWHGSPVERQRLSLAEVDLVVTSYGILRRDIGTLSQVPFHYVILDEAQLAKSAKSATAHSVRKLTARHRLALTGTPLENRAEELWAVFDFLAPGFLGSVRAFRRRYGKPIEQGDEMALSLLRAKTRPFILRRLKKEVARELPAKTESTVRCDMGDAQRALYDLVAGRLRQTVVEKIRKVGIERAHLDVLAALMRLRQICCDPALLPGPEGARRPPSAKLELFRDLMAEALAAGNHIVVFSQFVQMQKRLIEVIRKLGEEPLWLHGGTRDRRKVISAFQSGKHRIIVISLRAGGLGLTLTAADTVFHYDPWWNPAVENQATDRVHRIGQTKKVNVYKLICANSIEERVVRLAASKARLMEALLGSEGGAGAKRIDPREVLELLSPAVA